MASQQLIFEETIIAMKKAIKRKAYESDSDDDIDHATNRGLKLKKRARFVHEGQLAPPSGPEVYREVVNHAGYQRAIISRNPPLVDEEGYELDSDDEEYEARLQEVVDEAAQFDPYINLRLEKILAPLTAVTDLPTHPTLSRPYKSKTLTELANQGLTIMHKENKALWQVKHLQTKLSGDHTWLPISAMLGPHDLDLFRDDYVPSRASVTSDADMQLLDSTHRNGSMKGEGSVNGETSSKNRSRPGNEVAADADVHMADADADAPRSAEESRSDDTKRDGRAPKDTDKGEPESEPTVAVALTQPVAEDQQTDPENGQKKDVSQNGERSRTNGIAKTIDQTGEINEVHDLQVTVARNGQIDQMNSAAQSTTSEMILDEMFIHPLFLAPRSAHPDRDLGIPEVEAEELRRLLQLWCQKQEEVCRGVKKLYLGLLRADRLRHTVFQWSKYEAHCGPNRDMSDGEDWYDKEEWCLDDDLKKGQNEEDEEAAAAESQKKTRQRRN